MAGHAGLLGRLSRLTFQRAPKHAQFVLVPSSTVMTDPSVLQNAVTLHRVGHLAEAARLYGQVLDGEPENPDALHLLGVLTSQQGDHARAIELIEKAIALRPQTASFHVNLARAFHAAEDLDGAATALGAAVAKIPDDPQLFLLLADTQQRAGDLAAARTTYERALELDAGLAPAQAGLGRVLGEMAEHADAARLLQQSVERSPQNAAAWNDLGVTLNTTGNRNGAEEAYRKALQLREDYAEAHSNLGNLLAASGRAPDAIQHCQRALELKPELMEAHWTLGRALRRAGRDLEALATFRDILARQPEQWEVRISLLHCLQHHRPESFEPALDELLLELFESDDVAHQKLAFVTAAHLRHKHESSFKALQLDSSMLEALTGDRLFHLFLTRTFNTDVIMETFLNRSRRQCLLEPEVASLFGVPFLCALAQQCFNNDYVFALTPDEHEACASLVGQIDPQDLKTSPAAELMLAVVGCYLPLSGDFIARSAKWNTDFSALLQRTVTEPMQERLLAGQIPTLGQITDAVSKEVRNQYESNPYPRWVSIHRLPRLSFSERFRLRFPHFSPPPILDGQLEMLIAGCGTGRDAISSALNYKNVHVLAVDLSRRSLAYAMRMAKDLGADNIVCMQADILGLAELDRTFAVIQSVGVLHHMAQPLEGWRILADRLAPGGIMKVGLYSDTARQDVVEARRRIAALELEADADSIRRFRHSVLSDPESDLASLTRFVDFFNLSECRDLLFHVQECRFTVSQIDSAISQLGLSFVGFELDDARLRDRYLERFPDDGCMQSLDNWNRLEDDSPDIFTGMYQFWVHKPPA